MNNYSTEKKNSIEENLGDKFKNKNFNYSKFALIFFVPSKLSDISRTCKYQFLALLNIKIVVKTITHFTNGFIAAFTYLQLIKSSNLLFNLIYLKNGLHFKKSEKMHIFK